MKHLSLVLISIIFFSTTTLSGCSSMPGAHSGNDLSHLSLRDKRMADKKVTILKSMPSKVSPLGKVETVRCQSSVFSAAPEEKTLLVDMKAEAYRLGANAIAGISIQQKGAMGEGCWNLYTATANMFVIE